MTTAEEKKFWETQRPESRVKALLVSNYFPQYCRIVDRGKGEFFIYVDLWAGRGKYDAENSPEIKRYLNKPSKKINNPALLFFDPFGYAGIDTCSLANFLKPWGNELFLFLNVNRVIPALTNPKVTDHIAAMFPKFKEQVVTEVRVATNDEKKVSILLKFLAAEFKSIIGVKLHHCAFRFMESTSTKTSHLVIHFTKHPSGFKLVKQVYYDYDNIGALLNADGTFTFDAKRAYPTGIIDFNTDDNYINLAEDLAKKFAGKELSAEHLINLHHPGTKYAPSHYVHALRRLAEQGRLEARFIDNIEHRVTVLPSVNCILKFPANGQIIN